MKKHIAFTSLSLAAVSLASASLLLPAAAASGPVGAWRIEDGTAIVDIRPCGTDLCGYVASAKDSESSAGEQVFYNMKPDGQVWSGTIVDIQDGQRYNGKISLVSDRTLKVEGCVMGGMFCGGQEWSRVDAPELRQSLHSMR